MKILHLVAENVKKLRAVEITPHGEVVTIAGKNGQGKTSVLDSIWWALAGTSHIQKEPIRRGQKTARIKLDLGELKVERRFTEKGGTLIVENAEGARFGSPQKMLDALIGALSFDPLEFARAAPREQFDALRKIAKVEIDLDDLEGKNRGDFARRTEVNREIKMHEAQLDAMPPAEGAPGALIDTAPILQRLTDAGREYAAYEGALRARARERDENTVRGQTAARRIDELERQKAAIEQEIKDNQSVMDECLRKTDELANLPDLATPPDSTAIRAELERADQQNRLYERVRQRAEKTAQIAELQKRSSELTDQMEKRARTREAAIAAAEMPIPGLGLGDGVVTYQDIPFEQISSAEQLRVSLAIAMAANPKLRVIRITDGSLLDENSMAEISRLAKENDYQVWVERVDSTGKVGIVIEDGAVVAVNE